MCNTKFQHQHDESYTHEVRWIFDSRSRQKKMKNELSVVVLYGSIFLPMKTRQGRAFTSDTRFQW